MREKLKFLSYAPIVFLSALTGDRVEKLYTLLDRVAVARDRRISTGELNRWLANVDLERGTSPADREVKIFYITQATTAPPTFVLFTNQLKPLHFSYQRFLENRLRAAFDFTGTPMRFNQRLKKRAPRATHIAPRGEDREKRRNDKRFGEKRRQDNRGSRRDKSRTKSPRQAPRPLASPLARPGGFHSLALDLAPDRGLDLAARPLTRPKISLR